MKAGSSNIKKTEVANVNAEVVTSPVDVANAYAEVIVSPAEVANTHVKVAVSPAEVVNANAEVAVSSAEDVNANEEAAVSPVEVANTNAEAVVSPDEVANANAAMVVSAAGMLPSIDTSSPLKEIIEAPERITLKTLHDLSAYIKKTMYRCSIHYIIRLVIVTKAAYYNTCKPGIFEGALGHDPDT